MSWLDIFRIAWPIATTITPIMLLAGFLWLQTKFVTKNELEALDKRQTKALQEAIAESANSRTALDRELRNMVNRQTISEERILTLLKESQRDPSRNDLNNNISMLQERMARVESTSEAALRQLDAQSRYLHSIVENYIPKQDR